MEINTMKNDFYKISFLDIFDGIDFLIKADKDIKNILKGDIVFFKKTNKLDSEIIAVVKNDKALIISKEDYQNEKIIGEIKGVYHKIK